MKRLRTTLAIGYLFALIGAPSTYAEDAWFGCKQNYDGCVTKAKEVRDEASTTCQNDFGPRGENDFQKLAACKRNIPSQHSSAEKDCQKGYNDCTYEAAKKNSGESKP